MTNKDKQLSLNIKTDENNKALPLGIKSTVEGIEHFTNWDDVANSIDETGKLRRDRSSLKRVIFENERTPDVITRTNTYSQHSQFKYSVDDSWDVNKIKILDDLAFVAEDEYTDIEKHTVSVSTEAYQYFVARNFVGIQEDSDVGGSGTSGLAGGGGNVITPGFSTWTSSGAYTGHMPFMPGGGYAAGPYSGTFTIKYIPSTNTWEISGTIPNTGGWGGTFTGSATYDACSGGSTNNLDITISGTHYCTATSQNEAYSGTVRLNISPGNSGDESTCSAAITINSVSFGVSQYSSSGGCYITYSHSGISYNGYTSPVTDGGSDDTSEDDVKPRAIQIKRRIGTLGVDLRAIDGGVNQLFLNCGGSLFDRTESGKRKLTPLTGDYTNLYIKLNASVLHSDDNTYNQNTYFKFGGFLGNDFSESSIYVRGVNEQEDNDTLSGIAFNSSKNRKLKNTDNNLTNQMGPFSPPDASINLPPINYSSLGAKAYPEWNVDYSLDNADAVLYESAMYAFGSISQEELDNNSINPIVTSQYLLPLSDLATPKDSALLNGQVFYQAVNASGRDTRGTGSEAWKSGEADQCFLNLDTAKDIASDRNMPTSLTEGSLGGYYYLIFDDTGEQPEIVGVQFDIAENSIDKKTPSSVVDGGASLGSNFIGIVEGLSSEPDKVPSAQKGLCYSVRNVVLDFVKVLPIRKCGKVDVYKRKSGIVRSITGNNFLATGHGLNDKDIIEISGALYGTAGVGVSDVHPLNGKFEIELIDADPDNMFKLINGPSLSDLSNIRSVDGITWRSVSSGLGQESEGWSYEGSVFSPTGRNGYFKGLYNTEGVNKLATQDEFYNTNRINFSDIESGVIDFSKDLEGWQDQKYNRGVNLSIKHLLDVIPEVSSDMKICGLDQFRSFGLGVNQLYPYVNQNKKSNDPFRNFENYSGSRFGCDLDIKFSHYSGTSKVYTLAVGEIGSDVSVNLFGLSSNAGTSEGYVNNGCSFADDNNVIKFYDARRFVPEYLPYGKTHVINITIDQYNNVTSVDHRDSLFGGGNGIGHGTQPRGNDLLDQTERHPWTDLEISFRKTDYNDYGLSIKGASTFSLSDVFASEDQYLGPYLGARSSSESSARYYKSSYWDRHSSVHWFAQNIPNIYAFREGQIDGAFLNPLIRNFGKMFRPSLQQDKDQKIISYFGNETGIKTIDRFNLNNENDRYGYWSIFPWVDSYGKSVSLVVDDNLKGSSDSIRMAILSASTSKANRTFNIEKTELPQPSIELTPVERRIGRGKTDNEIGQLNLVYLSSNFGNTYNQFGYAQIAAGGSSGFPSRGFSQASKTKSGISGSFAGKGAGEILASCHLSYSDVIFEKDRIIFSEQRLASNDSIIHILDFNSGATSPVSKNHTISRPFNFPRDSQFSLNNTNLDEDIFNVGDGFGSTFKVCEDLLLTNATDVIDEFNQVIKAPDASASNVTSSVVYGIDQIFVYEKFKDVFEFSQKITASTKQKVKKSYKDRSLTLVDDLTVPLSAMNYDNSPNGTFAWNISLIGRYDLADTKIVLQDPESVVIFDRDFSESESMGASSFIRTPEKTSAKIEQFSHEDTSTLTYSDVSANVRYDCRINIADYRLQKGKYSTLAEKTPILNYNLDGDEDLYISSLKVNFDLRDVINDISTTFTAGLGNRVLVPRVVLYTRDPEGVVTRNRSSSLTTSASNFYSLDDSRRSKKTGGYIAPTKSDTDIGGGLNFGAGFMGQHRGGAQDLFFYGTLDGTTPVTAQEVFAGEEPRTTLPYLYGGQSNLQDFTSGCSWIAPDVYHKYNIDQINQIKPYAKIFAPTLQSDGSYSVTITSSDLNFEDFIDKARGGIWLGFVLTNVNSFDINSSEITYQELADGQIKDNSHISYQPIDRAQYSNNIDNNIGPFKYILPAAMDGLSSGSREMSLWFNARYPYCRVGVYPGVDRQGARTVIKNTKGKGSRTKSLACFAEATVVNPKLEISGFVTTGRRYKTSFSRKVIIDLKDSYTQKTFDGDNKSVIAIGKSSTSSNNLDLKKGSFANSYQVLSSTDGNISNPTTLELKSSNILSSFDVQRPEFLSLTVKGLFKNEEITTLFTPAPTLPSSGIASLVLSPVKDFKDTTTTLFTGLRDFDGIEPLFLKMDIAENSFSLNISELAPSAIAPMFTKTVDASGGIDLAFAPLRTGVIPLLVSGPITNSGIATLNVDGSAFIEDGHALYASGAFHSSGAAPLHTIASVPVNNLISLAMNLPQSGSVSLYIRKDFDASGQAPLTIFDKAVESGNLNVFIGTQFDIENKGLNLFTDSPLLGTGQIPLQIEGFALTANSNRNSNSELLSVLPDGEFDKGDPDGSFNEDPINKTSPSSKTVLSNSVLGNAIVENFYERNRNLVSTDGSDRLQVDTKYPSIFAKQRSSLTRNFPSLKKKGTLDPAWNFAYGTNGSRGGLAVDPSTTPVIDQNLIKRFYDNNDGRTEYYEKDVDLIEKDFYDSSNDVLVKAGMIDDNVIEIGIYDIDGDGNLSQRGLGGREGVLRFAPASIPLAEDGGAIASTERLDGVQVNARRGSSPIYLNLNEAPQVIDAFFPIRRKIFQRIRDDFYKKIKSDNSSYQTPYMANWKSGTADLCDLKVSKNGICAISFRVTSEYEFYFKTGPESGTIFSASRRETFKDTANLVVIFNIDKYTSHPFGDNLSFTTFKQNFPSLYGVSAAKTLISGLDIGWLHGGDYTSVILPLEENNQTGYDSTFSESQTDFTGTSYLSGTSIAFDYDDLYVNTQGHSFGRLLALKSSRRYLPDNLFGPDFSGENTGTASQQANKTTDWDYYSRINRRFITDFSDGYAKPFFGSKVKIFEEYQSNKSIMLVGAMLFDPYVLQALSGSHKLNPIGAVYIFKKDKEDDGWTYHGAVYGKGYTSENVRSNLSQYRGGLNSIRQVGLFGYDFDYSEGVLSVSEPGGDGDNRVNAGRVYTFDISSAPSLLKTHSASDITVNSSALGYGDNFGTNVVSFGRRDIFTFSDKALDYLFAGENSRTGWSRYSLRYEGESLIHNVRNNSSFGFGSTGSSGLLNYSRENTLNELRPYFTDGLKSGAYPESSSAMQVWSRILSIKKISAKDKDRLLVVRKFAFRLNSQGQTTTDFRENSFNVVKLQVLDLERGVNGPLFITAANANNNLAPLFNLAPGPSGNFNLAIKPIDYCSGLAPLFLDNRNSFSDISLHTPRVSDDGNIFLPLAVSGFAPSAANQAKLFLKHQYSIATPDLFMPVVGVEKSDVLLTTQGSAGEGFSDSPSLVINRHITGISENGFFGLFLNQKNFNAASLFGAGGASNPAIDLVVGTFAINSGVDLAPLTIKTFIPPIGPGGGFVGSGIITIAMSGNNDAGVYSKGNGNVNLFLPSRDVANSGNVLFIEKSFGGVSPLYINSQISSGIIPTYVTGAGIDSSGINLVTKTEQTGNFNIFTRGWFE